MTQGPGYRLEVADEDVDVRAFELLVRRSQTELDARLPDAASHHVTRAVALWRGPLLSNLPVGPVLASRTARLEELHLRALELRIEIAVARGQFRHVLPDLRALVEEYPCTSGSTTSSSKPCTGWADGARPCRPTTTSTSCSEPNWVWSPRPN